MPIIEGQYLLPTRFLFIIMVLAFKHTPISLFSEIIGEHFFGWEPWETHSQEL